MKIQVNFKICDLTEIIVTHNCNTHVAQGNQTIKFGQLTQYNMRSIFLEKSYTKYERNAIPRPFHE